MKDLSIIIPSFNTANITVQTIRSIEQHLHTINGEIIVVDNASTDDSVDALSKIPNIQLIPLSQNVGFSKANNIGLQKAQGKYILFLNSDMLIENIEFNELLNYLDQRPKVGALTVKVHLQKGGIDPASHRGFPTLWRSFTYFVGLERAFQKIPGLNRLFGGYHLVHKSLNTPHAIDAPSGAFFLTRKNLMEELQGFDEQFFMYGEDLDLAFRIKEKGYSVIYYPKFHVTHLKYQSGLKNQNEQVKKKIRKHFYEAMGIFYQKHFYKKYPSPISQLVLSIIDQKIKNI